MSDLRTRLEAAVFEASPKASYRGIGPEEIVDVLLSLPGIAIVELPDEGGDSSWHIDDIDVTITQAWGGVRLVDAFGGGVDLSCAPTEARQFAAALLAAANAAESVTK